MKIFFLLYSDFESDYLEVANLLHRYASLLLQISDSMGNCGIESLNHIVQKQNKGADFLANEGANLACSAYSDSLPSKMESLLLLYKLGSKFFCYPVFSLSFYLLL